ncbi:hypothetical protein BH11BAC2_BH11BAC2_03040 [soil metagenome]
MKIQLYLFLLLITIQIQGRSQGCSDAGFCTIGSMQHQVDGNDTTLHQSLSVILTNGIGDEGVYVFTPAVQYENQINRYLLVQAKITANYASGNLGDVSGLGDFYLTGSYSFIKNKKWSKVLTAALKLPLDNSNLKLQDKSLPMGYQSSLGTVDFIAGFTIRSSRWIFSLGYQQPLNTPNGNTFLPSDWNTAEANKFSPTNKFDRKADVLLKAGYKINALENLHFNLGLLAIYHLANDTYNDLSISDDPITLKDSDGLTLNGTLNLVYKMSSRFSLGLTAGTPLIVRDLRPDGLTRAWVISPELIYKF